MHARRTHWWRSGLTLLVALLYTARSQQSSEAPTRPHANWSCEQLDFCADKLGFEAIEWLHHQLDDDASGTVDIAESKEFLRDELKYENGYERQKAFHGNDKQISVDELWKAWKSSDVRNWTVDETVEWLINTVELPQYVEQFQHNAVDGMALPRLAANTQFISILGINNPIHKQKLALKAMDVVLFGAPKHHNYVKDGILVFLLVIAVSGCWFAWVQHKSSQKHLKKMLRDMDNLQKAEEQLTNMQNELYKIREERQMVVEEKYNLEKKLTEKTASYTELTDLGRMNELEDEVHRLRDELKRAQTAHNTGWRAPHNLQLWLQLTHELEIRHYNSKRLAAESQLYAAKEGCERLRKKRSSLLGAFRVAHGSSIDDVDNRILQAKTALSEVTKDLQERLHRWKQIEMFCGFPIIQNSGIEYLQTVLYGSPLNGSPPSLASMGRSRTLPEQDETDTDDNLSGSMANVSMAGFSLQSSFDRSLLSINNNSVRKPSTGTMASNISTIGDHSDEERDDDISQTSIFTIGNSSIRDTKQVTSEARARPRLGNLPKSYSEDQSNSYYRNESKLATDVDSIYHSESCAELQTCVTPVSAVKTVTDVKVGSDIKTSSDSPTPKANTASTHHTSNDTISKITKSFDDSLENTSNDSNSVKDFKDFKEDKSERENPKKRSLFGLRKRKTSKN